MINETEEVRKSDKMRRKRKDIKERRRKYEKTKEKEQEGNMIEERRKK